MKALKGITVLSLFDGMSCGQIALNRLGIKVDKYFASEIKPHAIKVTKDNYPNTIHIGDVRKVSYSNGILYTENGTFETQIDILIGGSPCKGLSKLNKNKEGLLHKESVLFYEYVRLKGEINPDFFLFENVVGDKGSTSEISKILSCDKILINSKLVSAQNRSRYYWTNLVVDPLEDRKITTADVFDRSGNETSSSRVKWIKGPSGIRSIQLGFTRVNPYPKSGCITALGYAKWNCNYLLVDDKYYDLSINEVERLQTVDEGYCKTLTYNEAYDVLGDGWTIEVICHIFKSLKNYYESN